MCSFVICCFNSINLTVRSDNIALSAQGKLLGLSVDHHASSLMDLNGNNFLIIFWQNNYVKCSRVSDPGPS